MELLTLTLAQFVALAGAVSVIALALYMLDRSRKRQIVSTLRFWSQGGQPSAVSRKRRLRQPWSLLLQLLGMLLLLLAIAEFRFGGTGGRPRDHVLVLDTSAWMGASPLMDEARASSLGWLRAIPAEDRVMLIRADGLTTPVTAWETDHRHIARAILESTPGVTALHLTQALSFAEDLRSHSGGTPGEIAYAGPGRITAAEAKAAPLPVIAALRYLPTKAVIGNLGIRAVSAHRADLDTWDVLVRAGNDGAARQQTIVSLRFGQSPQGSRSLTLAPREQSEVHFTVRTEAAGLLEASLSSQDGFAADNFAALELPPRRAYPVIVYTDQPETARAALSSEPRVMAEFRTPSQAKGVAASGIWIDPPPDHSPIPIRARVQKPDVTWQPDQPIAKGLRSRLMQLEAASVFEAASEDSVIARADGGAVIVARPGMVVFGFNPFAGPSRNDVATPLLLANALTFLAPDIFRDIDVTTQSPGEISLPIDGSADRSQIRVLTDNGIALPFTMHERAIEFFAGEASRVRVTAGNSDRVYSLTLPDAGDAAWAPPDRVRRGVPAASEMVRRNRTLWPWLAVLGGALLLADWSIYGRRKRLPFLLKLAMAACVVAALFTPALHIDERKVAVAVLMDNSASISETDARREQELLGQLEGARGSNRVESKAISQTPRAQSTNFEKPLREALASLPPDTIHRILLISDGNENSGSSTRIAWQAKQLGVSIDTMALAGRERPKLRIQAIGLPGAVFTGERFPVDLTISSPLALKANVEFKAEGHSLGRHQIDLAQGESHVRIRANLNTAGAIKISGELTADGAGQSRFESVVAVRKPKVTWISTDPAESEEHIRGVFSANGFDFTTASSVPKDLSDTQVLVLNNQNLETVDASDKQRIETFVKGGGGALVIAGENNVYIDKKGIPEDALERLFPAKLAPPRSQEGTCLILIIDKSSSMEGKKMDLARLAAIGVVENLKPEDEVGVLMFDNSFQWAVPIRKADDKAFLKRQIAGITPDGGTQIAPALNTAYRGILPVKATYRHIVLLTDGISEEGDSFTLSKEAALNRVTISTVGLGQDVNRSYLEKVASLANGKSYFLNDPSGLEQILLRDVKEHTGTTAVEKSIRARLKHPSDLMEKIDIGSSPALEGYVRFETKPSADEVLAVDEHDPLLVRWQYGLGRSAVFASDAKSRWAAKWLTWSGFDRLWTNIFRDLLPRGNESEATARYDAANDEIIVDYNISDKVTEAVAPALYAMGPENFQKPMNVVRVSSNAYRASVGIGSQQGLFRIRPLLESGAFPEVGLYRQPAEMSDYGANEPLLKSLAAATGGRFNPEPGEVFENRGHTVPSTLRLWPGLLALALALNLAELTLRKL